MSKCVYINGIGAVSTQGAWRQGLFHQAQELNHGINEAVSPSYKELIAPAMLRRMSNGVKMGIHAAQQALDESFIVVPDAVITGTGLGCSIDSEKFLRGILDNQEEFLTPTSFIQSTHNTVAAQIALRLGCKGYNFTYVHRSVSFESAALDGLMQLQDDQVRDILLGGVDELSQHTYGLLQLIGQIKQNGLHETVKCSVSKGVNYAEGATFFTLSSERKETSYAQLIDVSLQHDLDHNELSTFVENFLIAQKIDYGQIDAIVLGINGDREYDKFYDIFGQTFGEIPTLYYKHLIGQYDTSSAFGLAVAARVLKDQEIPDVLFWNTHKMFKTLTNILVYNQFNGKDHSLILVRAC